MPDPAPGETPYDQGNPMIGLVDQIPHRIIAFQTGDKTMKLTLRTGATTVTVSMGLEELGGLLQMLEYQFKTLKSGLILPNNQQIIVPGNGFTRPVKDDPQA